MTLINCHTHTVHSGHGEGTIAELADAAAAAGITTLAVTEHLPLPAGIDPGLEFSMAPGFMDSYRAQIEEARRAHPEMEIVTGGELDWLSWRDDNLASRRAACEGIEFVLGSVHFIDGWGFDDPAHRSPWEDPELADAAWRRYLQIWCEMAESDLPIDCLSHPDLVKKFGVQPRFDLTEWNGRMAEAAARSGRMIELNTAGLRKEVGEEYPGPDLLKAFCRAGVDCTIGTDAHSPREVALGLDRAVAALREAGYNRVAVPTRDHDRRYLGLDDLSVSAASAAVRA